MPETEIDDNVLVGRILSGEREAFRLLVIKYKRLVSHIVFRMVDDENEREDICQEVFLKIYKNLRGYRNDAKLSTWIGAVAYNTGLNFLKKGKKAEQRMLSLDDSYGAELPAGDSADPALLSERNDLGNRIRKEIQKMPPVYRTVITLFHLDELSYQEMAGVMNMPEGTIKSHLFRAREHLRRRLLICIPQEDLCR